MRRHDPPLPFRGFCGNGHPAGAEGILSRPLFLEDSRRDVPLGYVNDRPTWKINMPLYEHVFLARQDLAQAQVDALAENATKIIEDNGGKVAKTETWGLRSLAYRIAKNRKAHYVMLDLDAPAAAIAELERQSNINEDIIRFLTIRVDEHEKGPSAMMRRGDKDRERGPRSDRPERAEFRAREEEVE
jgi:small subunit ribosomal protein S6